MGAGIAEDPAAHRGASRADSRDRDRRIAQPKRAHLGVTSTFALIKINHRLEDVLGALLLACVTLVV